MGESRFATDLSFADLAFHLLQPMGQLVGSGDWGSLQVLFFCRTPGRIHSKSCCEKLLVGGILIFNLQGRWLKKPRLAQAHGVCALVETIFHSRRNQPRLCTALDWRSSFLGACTANLAKVDVSSAAQRGNGSAAEPAPRKDRQKVGACMPDCRKWPVF